MELNRSVEQRPEAAELEAFKQRLRRLEAENEDLSRDLRRFKRKPSRLWGLTLLAVGGASLAAATAYSSLIPAFIGLGLTFWGVLLLYIRPVRYIRKELLDSMAPNTLGALRQLVNEMGYRGKGVYLPPRTLREHGTSTLVIPRSYELEVPTVKRLVEPTAPLSDPAGLVLTPPGLGLARLIQKELGRDLSTADLGYLANNLPKVIIEDLEMADDVEIEPSGDRVLVRLKRPLLTVRTGEKAELEELDYLPSAIACILTWTTGKPITIENLTISKDGQITEARFRILEA